MEIWDRSKLHYERLSTHRVWWEKTLSQKIDDYYFVGLNMRRLSVLYRGLTNATYNMRIIYDTANKRHRYETTPTYVQSM